MNAGPPTFGQDDASGSAGCWLVSEYPNGVSSALGLRHGRGLLTSSVFRFRRRLACFCRLYSGMLGGPPFFAPLNWRSLNTSCNLGHRGNAVKS